MCGRFVSTTPAAQLAAYFDVDLVTGAAESHRPDTNTAPTSDVLVVVETDDVRRLDAFHWGLVPSWAKDPSIGNRMINARSETAAEKPSFRRAFTRRRCLVPVDGFYEWARVAGQKVKQPYFIHRPDDEPYALAGLWEQWTPPTPDGPDLPDEHEAPPAQVPLRSVTILTTGANRAMAAVHDRMPVVVPPSGWDAWLSPQVQDREVVSEFLVAAPDALFRLRPVSTEVNNVRHKGEHLLERVSPIDGAPDGAPD